MTAPKGPCDRTGCKRKARVWLMMPWGAVQECLPFAGEDGYRGLGT